MKLRPYQSEAVLSIYDYFRIKQGNPILVLPTGSGKSVVIAEFVRGVLTQWPNQRILILTHTKDIIAQNFDKLKKVWPQAPAGIYSAGLGIKHTHHPITFAGVASIKNNIQAFGWIDLVLVDECHTISSNRDASMYRGILNELAAVNPNVKVIGFTATPFRSGEGALEEGKIFTDICFDIGYGEKFVQLVNDGYLCRLVPKSMNAELDVSKVNVRGGDFVEKDLQEAVDKYELSYAACEEAAQLAEDRNHWLVFTTGIEHAENVCEILNTMGIPSTCIHSRLSAEEENQRKADFTAYKYRALINVGKLTTGYDDPNIDCIVMLRPSKSAMLWVQMLGRGTRVVYAPGFDLETTEGRLAAIAASHKPNCLVLDFAGNTARIGPINDPVIPKKRGEGRGSSIPPVKICPTCNTYHHSTVRICSECGYEFPSVVDIQTSASERKLIKEDEAPEVVILSVDHISIARHKKKGKPDSVKITYYCGARSFNQYLCPEHGGFATRSSKQWWKKRSEYELPETVDGVLREIDRLPVTTHVRVWINKLPYPQVMDECTDGTAFGTEESNPMAARPSQDVAKAPVGKSEAPMADFTDDDIPF